MKLSIGMIVKNEEKYLERCLNAIKPILDNVDSELIIVDTGSTDKTVEIAKRYTDKVLFFEWIKDFSAARNFGMKKAVGEWFMMLDADDIFQGCDDIINFFNSGEYKDYNAGSYISRNFFKTETSISFNDFNAARMIRLTSDTRYEGIVHESLTGFNPPYKALSDIADHYGYLYENDEEKHKKFERNIELLLKRFEKEKDINPTLHMQLFEAYTADGQYDKAFIYVDSGIELSKKKKDITLAALYYNKANLKHALAKYNDVIEICSEYFNMDKLIRPYPLMTDGEIYGLKAESLYSLGRYKEAAGEFKSFFSVLKDIESGKLKTTDSFLVSLNLCSAPNILPLYREFIESCINIGDYDTARSYLISFPAFKYNSDLDKSTALSEFTFLIAEHFGFTDISDYSSQMDENGKLSFASELILRCASSGYKNLLLDETQKLSGDDPTLHQRIDIAKTPVDMLSFDVLKSFSDKYGVDAAPELVYYALKRQFEFTQLLKHENCDVKKCAFICCKKIYGFFDLICRYPASLLRNAESIKTCVKFVEYCLNTALLDSKTKLYIEPLLAEYAALGERFVTEFNMEYEPYMIAAAKTSKIIELKRQTKYNECISTIKSVVSVYSGIAPVLSEYSGIVLNEYKKSREQQDKISEMSKLSAMLKNNIRSLIEKGNRDAAKQLLDEYIMIASDDPDIPELMNSLNAE